MPAVTDVRWLLLRPAEAWRVLASVAVPHEPGEYLLELGVEQIEGARFDGAGNAPVRQRVKVARADAGVRPATSFA